MKVLKKVFTAIGHFFRNIWRYIMANAWVQPILIVALIFAIIFGLTGIPSLIESVKGWFDDTKDSKIKRKYSEKIDIDEFYELYEGNKSFVLVIGAEDCAECKTLFKTVNNYMDDKDHRDLVDTEIYYLNITKLLDEIEEDIEDYGDVRFNIDSDNFDKLDRLSTLLYNSYASIIGEFKGDDVNYSELESYGKFADAYGIMTPTTVFFTADDAKDAKNSKVFNIVVGDWDWGKNTTTADSFGINLAFEYWHESKDSKKWNDACSKRDTLNQNHIG